MSKRYLKQPSFGLKVGDKVKVDHTRINQRTAFEGFRDFYGDNVGEIIGFLDKETAPNHGSALVRIVQKFGQELKVYIDTYDLVKHASERPATESDVPAQQSGGCAATCDSAMAHQDQQPVVAGE